VCRLRFLKPAGWCAASGKRLSNQQAAGQITFQKFRLSYAGEWPRSISAISLLFLSPFPVCTQGCFSLRACLSLQILNSLGDGRLT
jgi:hypothetical protein